MTPEQINVAVAEALGWKKITCGGIICWETPSGNPRIPNFYSSLDACAEMERTLNGSSDDEESERTKYGDILTWVVYETDSPNAVYTVDLATATAPQRCEAFLRVKGKWKE